MIRCVQLLVLFLTIGCVNTTRWNESNGIENSIRNGVFIYSYENVSSSEFKETEFDVGDVWVEYRWFYKNQLGIIKKDSVKQLCVQVREDIGSYQSQAIRYNFAHKGSGALLGSPVIFEVISETNEYPDTLRVRFRMSGNEGVFVRKR